jgi:hypothetical protein
MTFRIHSIRRGASELIRCFSLVLLPALTTEAGSTGFSQGHNEGHRPVQTLPPTKQPRPTSYLAIVGPPPLRFQDAPAPPPYELEPTPAGPALIEDMVTQPPPQHPTPVATNLPLADGLPAEPVQTHRAQLQADEPAPIIPDDLRREVRPEDVIPYFQFPRNRVRVGVPIPPQPSGPSLPPSSATYQQQ